MTQHVNEVSSTHQLYYLNVYVVTKYYNFSLKLSSLNHFKTAALFYENNQTQIFV